MGVGSSGGIPDCLLELCGYYFYGALGAIAGVAASRIFPSLAMLASGLPSELDKHLEGAAVDPDLRRWAHAWRSRRSHVQRVHAGCHSNTPYGDFAQ